MALQRHEQDTYRIGVRHVTASAKLSGDSDGNEQKQDKGWKAGG
jgi:hypothetical protein